MCAGLRLGCKDSSGNDYFLLSFFKKKSNKNRYYFSVQDITLPFSKPRWCGVRLQVESFHQAGFAGHQPVPTARVSAGLVEGALLVPRGRQRDGPLLTLTGG